MAANAGFQDIFNAINVLLTILAIILAFLTCVAGTVLSARGLFATKERLLEMSKQIGTKNMIVARMACFAGLIVCSTAGLGILIAFMIPLYLAFAQ